MLHVLTHGILTTPYRVSTSTLPILQMREMSHREIKWHAQVHRASKWQRRSSSPGSLAPERELWVSKLYHPVGAKWRNSHTGLLLFRNRLALLKCLSFFTCESLSRDSGYCLHADLSVGQCAPRAGGTVGDAFFNLTVWPNSLNSGFSINESWCLKN